MANVYNALPILLDTDTTQGWRSLQTLNTGNLPTNAQQLSGAVTRQWGIRVTRLILSLKSGGTQAAANVVVQDPNDSTILWEYAVPASGGLPVIIDSGNSQMNWRDFKVTGLTTSNCLLEIWYRA